MDVLLECMYAQQIHTVHTDQKKATESPELGFQMVLTSTWVLRNEPGSSAGIANAVSH